MFDGRVYGVCRRQQRSADGGESIRIYLSRSGCMLSELIRGGLLPVWLWDSIGAGDDGSDVRRRHNEQLGSTKELGRLDAVAKFTLRTDYHWFYDEKRHHQEQLHR